MKHPLIFLIRSRTSCFLSIPVFILTSLFASCTMQMSELVSCDQAGLNGGFEYTENGKPYNWLLYTPNTTGEGEFDLVTDTLDPKEGKYAFKYIVQQCNSRGGRFSPGIAREISVQPGEKYRVSYWIKNESAAYRVRLSAVNSFEESPGPAHHSTLHLPVWTFYEHEYIIPASMNKLRFEMNVLAPGTCSIDEINITKL